MTSKKTRHFLIKSKLLHSNLFMSCKLTCLAIGAGVASDTGAGVQVDVVNASGTIQAR
jgi:hypothetical protein